MMKNFSYWTLGFVATAVTILIYWMHPSILHRLELLSQDAHFQWRGPIPPGPEVVIATIDEKSIDELGRWPWSRNILTQLVEKLVQRQAKVIGFDLIFSSSDNSSGLENLRKLRDQLQPGDGDHPAFRQTLDRFIKKSDYDAQFARVLEESGRAVLGYFFHFSPTGLEHLTEKMRHRYFENIRSAQFGGFIKSHAEIDLSAIQFRSAYAVESNIPAFSKTARNSGFISIDIEPDGSVRKLPLIVKYHDQTTAQDYFFPPISVRIIEKFLEGTLLFRIGDLGVEQVLLSGKNTLEIPTNQKGELHINFLGKRGTFPHYSITDIIHDRKNQVPDGSLRGKIVLVGATATALEDLRSTPFDPAYSGVEVHATIIDNLLHQNSLQRPDWLPLAEIAYLILLGGLLTLVYSRMKPAPGILAWLAMTTAHFSLSHWLWEHSHLWVTDVYPILENLLVFSFLMLHRYQAEVKQKQFIQNVFGKYLSPRVIDGLLKDPGNLKLGGEQKELTAFFSDLEGFTPISEKLPPRELVSLLNTFFTEMTDILLENEGTLDKYDGDSIKAFFGAPLYFEDHAKRACWTCIEMQEKLGELRARWKAEGKPELFMRVGINTGLMIVGNIGSKNRLNYGMSGDAVNLASRLEGSNKEYGTYSLISESTYVQAREFIEARELDSIRVVGRTTPIKTYELLGKSGSMKTPLRELLPLYNEGLGHYKKRRWEAALTCFDQALQIDAGDGPSLTFQNRCRHYIKHPPPEIWDGVFALSSK